ncbi:MAG: hypothetical protein LAT77_07560 [Aliidiomarina sp.]|uniref:sigma-E factor negative regulatory protein n=1 Tax=Aliidiomarina sp. TaxID=1872439 RepID=UPI0025BEA253|nr:RseA family anti-sigma factor [Aliidiomarina sp.]MCH8501751.1 hypothetical protein [Aliidiomarina sp.]
MTEHQQEKLSALLDGQLDTDAMQDLVENAAHRERWFRYQLVGAMLRGEVKEGQSVDISAAVAAAVAAEPQYAQAGSNAHSAWTRLKLWAGQRNWVRPAANVAVAASVAVVAIVGIQNLQPIDDGAPALESTQRSATVLETMPLGGVINPVSFNTVAAPASNEGDADFERRLLQSFFMDHQQQLQLNEQAEVELHDVNIDKQDP